MSEKTHELNRAYLMRKGFVEEGGGWIPVELQLKGYTPLTLKRALDLANYISPSPFSWWGRLIARLNLLRHRWL